MPGLDGFAVLRRLLTSDRRFELPAVVFATAFDQYAVKAFEVNAVDYLLKPFDSKRLKRTLEKIRARLRLNHEGIGADSDEAEAAAPSLPQHEHRTSALPHAPLLAAEVTGAAVSATPGVTNQRTKLWEVAQAKLDALLRMVEEQATGPAPGSAAAPPRRTGRVVVEVGSRLLLVDQKDVCFARIEEGRITVVTKTLEGDSNVRTLEELADQLDAGQFWRAHRSFLVNIEHIREVVPWFKSSYQLRMDDRGGTEIPVSRSQTKRLRELFNL